MTNLKTTSFEHNYHGEEQRYDNISNEDYTRYIVDVYNVIEYKGAAFHAVYQTGCSYIHNNYSCPSPELELSPDGGTDSALLAINELCESELEDISIIESCIEDCGSNVIKTKEDVIALYYEITNNLHQAEYYFDSLKEDIESED